MYIYIHYAVTANSNDMLLSLLSFFRHAVFRFMDDQGHEIGQAVIQLDNGRSCEDTVISSYASASGGPSNYMKTTSEAGSEASDNSTSTAPYLASAKSAMPSLPSIKKSPQGYYEANLSSGGVHRGTVTFGVRISHSACGALS